MTAQAQTRGPDRAARKRRPSISVAVRFWSKVQISPGCWEWRGAKNQKGYGQINISRHMVKVHRWAYEQANGPIPAGMQLDHLCRNPSCVNPSHVEPVTNQENALRGWVARGLPTHCGKGHAFTPDNIYITRQGKGRACRSCQIQRSTERYRKNRSY